MPEMAYLELEDGFKIYLSMVDVAGPSFDLGYDKVKAFYQYERRDKDLMEENWENVEVFLDIGANIGHFGFYFKRKFPKLTCHLFEPIPWLGNCINKTIQENGLGGVYHHSLVLGDQNEKCHFFVDTFNDGGHSLLRDKISPRSRGGQSLTVQSRTLDSFDFARVDFIKVDIQGAEEKFIKGAVQTIKKFRPKMLVEVAVEKIIPFSNFLESETGLSYDIFLAGEDKPVDLSNLEKLEVVERNFYFKVRSET